MTFWYFSLSLISTAAIGVVAGRFWQRAIDLEAALELHADQENQIRAIDAETDAKATDMLLQLVEDQLEEPTADDLNKVIRSKKHDDN